MCCAHARKISRQLKISRPLYASGRFVNSINIGPWRREQMLDSWEKQRIDKHDSSNLKQICDETNSLTDLVRYTNTNMSLSISTSTISRILQQYNMASYIVPRKPRITPKQRRGRNRLVLTNICLGPFKLGLRWYSAMRAIMKVLIRKNRIYFRRFRTDRTRFERSQKRTHRGGASACAQHITAH